MRGCLFTLALGLAVLVGAVWYLLPAAAGALISVALVAAGLQGTGTVVTVSATPPFELLSGHADVVRVESTDATWDGLKIGDLRLALVDVDLGTRTAAKVEATLSAVRFSGSDGRPIEVETVEVAGSGDAPAVRLTFDPAVVAGMAAAAIEAETGRSPDGLRFAPPDRVSFVLLGRPIAGRLAVDRAGELVLRVAGRAPIVVLAPATDSPFRLADVAVTADGKLVLGGSLDLRALGLLGG